MIKIIIKKTTKGQNWSPTVWWSICVEINRLKDENPDWVFEHVSFNKTASAHGKVAKQTIFWTSLTNFTYWLHLWTSVMTCSFFN